MGAIKWIAGLLGWVSGGPIGALLGFFFGSMVDDGINGIKFQVGQGQDGNGQTGGRSTAGQGGSRSAGQGSGRTGGQSYRTGGYSATEQRNSFMVSLLVLSSAVIRADGKFLQSEFNYVRAFIRSNFGTQAEDEAMRILDSLNRQEINVYSVGGQIGANMNYSQRLQLFHYLVDLANADGEVCDQEVSVLRAIASAMYVNASDIDSILAMFSKAKESAYTVLEISPSATDDEVKAAYRRLAMKNHPDKVASLGPDVQKAAEAKFRKIQEAYETIKKARGLN